MPGIFQLNRTVRVGSTRFLGRRKGLPSSTVHALFLPFYNNVCNQTPNTKIYRYLYALQNKGIDTATPRQLFENLSARPRANFKTELFDIDRDRIEAMVNDPDHAVGVSLFKRLKRFGEAIFDDHKLEISEYHGRADVTIEFDSNFVPTLVDDVSIVINCESDSDDDSDVEDTDGDVELINV